MMIEPSLNELLDKVHCRYALVSVISKRSRQIVDQCSKGGICDVKQVSAAVDDLMSDRLEWVNGEQSDVF